MTREMLRIMSKRSKPILRHPDFVSRAGNGCERRLKSNGTKACRRIARVLVRIPSLAGYPELSVQLCRPCAKKAEQDWHGELIVGRSIFELLAAADSGETLAEVIETALTAAKGE